MPITPGQLASPHAVQLYQILKPALPAFQDLQHNLPSWCALTPPILLGPGVLNLNPQVRDLAHHQSLSSVSLTDVHTDVHRPLSSSSGSLTDVHRPQSSGSRSLTDVHCSQSSGSGSLNDVHRSQSSGSSLTDLAPQSSSSGPSTDVHRSRPSGSHSMANLTRLSLTQLPIPTEDGFKGLYKSFLKRNS